RINLAKGIIKTVMQIITGDWKGAWNTIKSTTSNFLSGIKNIISNILNAVLTIIRGILNNIKTVFSSIFNGLKNIVSTAFNGVKNAVKNGMTGAFNAVKGFFGKFKDAGKNITQSIADGITAAIGKVTGAISNVTQKIRDFLPFSPPKTGPLIDIMDVKWGETIGGGILKGEDEVANAMDEMLSVPLRPTVYSSGGFNDGNADVTSLLMDLIKAVREGKNIIMDDREVGRIVEPIVSEYQNRNTRVRENFA